ncbi:hypothetical protein LshimejAT787_0604040 [Lyophyllum shimeji]|uniref:Uncharacterized protein n=1 Tax=Lyophyllum shimeji TaxID=47721 RepID=A0A9P3PPY2_LYOSH|nr:hypothetical protein LshimejAT787_0604040 [Lyophyllum shimeji]
MKIAVQELPNVVFVTTHRSFLLLSQPTSEIHKCIHISRSPQGSPRLRRLTLTLHEGLLIPIHTEEIEVERKAKRPPRFAELKEFNTGASYHFTEGIGRDLYDHSPVTPHPVPDEDCIAHNVKLLQEFADRQAHPLCDDKIRFEFLDSSQFLLGTFKLLANRDKPGVHADEPSRQLPSQLLTRWLDLESWAKEYLRTLFGQTRTGALVPTLLTVVAANFYDLYIHVMDNIVEKALGNMETRRGACLEVADFAFSYELHLNQILPFFAEASHRVDDTHIANSRRPQVVVSQNEPPPTPLAPPGTTRSGRKVQPTRAKKQALEQKSSEIQQQARRTPLLRKKRARVERRDGPRPPADTASRSEEQAAPPTPAPAARPKARRPHAKPSDTVTGSSPKAPPLEFPPLVHSIPEAFRFTFLPPSEPAAETRAASEDISDCLTPEGTLIGYESDSTMLSLPKLKARTPIPTPALETEQPSRPPVVNHQKRVPITVPPRKSTRLASQQRGEASTATSRSRPSLTADALSLEQSRPRDGETGDAGIPPEPLTFPSPSVPRNFVGPGAIDFELLPMDVMKAVMNTSFASAGSSSRNMPCASGETPAYPAFRVTAPEARAAPSPSHPEIPSSSTDKFTAVAVSIGESDSPARHPARTQRVDTA